MAHFCKLGVGNIVERVEVVSNDIATSEQAGVEFLQNLYGDRAIWKQTSYNTLGGKHRLGGTPFRKNYGGIGYTYDETRDAFIPTKPYESWTLNEESCEWEAPIDMPITYTQEKTDADGNPSIDSYKWNETNKSWDLVD
tara:strand:+ start:173 stop:589 length:417 start_codon:yes stop_codon:yes gene_type:complete